MTKNRNERQATPVTPEQVADYLRANPDFFVQQPSLLMDLRIPHNSGKAVSLLEKQIAVMRESNTDLRHRLDKLMRNARESSALYEKTRRLVLALIISDSLDEMIDALLYSLKHDFKIEFATLILLGNPAAEVPPGVRVLAPEEARGKYKRLLGRKKIFCGKPSKAEMSFLFEEYASEVNSAALVPLNSGEPLGKLAVASKDASRYQSDMDTLFLEFIGDVLSRQIPLKSDSLLVTNH